MAAGNGGFLRITKGASLSVLNIISTGFRNQKGICECRDSTIAKSASQSCVFLESVLKVPSFLFFNQFFSVYDVSNIPGMDILDFDW